MFRRGDHAGLQFAQVEVQSRIRQSDAVKREFSAARSAARPLLNASRGSCWARTERIKSSQKGKTLNSDVAVQHHDIRRAQCRLFRHHSEAFSASGHFPDEGIQHERQTHRFADGVVALTPDADHSRFRIRPYQGSGHGAQPDASGGGGDRTSRQGGHRPRQWIILTGTSSLGTCLRATLQRWCATAHALARAMARFALEPLRRPSRTISFIRALRAQSASTRNRCVRPKPATSVRSESLNMLYRSDVSCPWGTLLNRSEHCGRRYPAVVFFGRVPEDLGTDVADFAGTNFGGVP